ncbi:alpha/beta hydrolase [Aurantibacter crassamenti]|uniref:alpha/beta hydrolase n=1 Tax=Aurantibacter crassamenti TaxID=1837375 RepID=UPI001939C0FE|nr:alpha/beta hydrolase [Aurantibacter crassamenti]MBM1106318.1 alpha/beta hydrolase [Aurantibacter crassamenti]
MKNILLLIVLTVSISVTGQQLVLKKGVVIDSVMVTDTIPQSFSLYLPRAFEMSKSWPVVFVFDTDGKGEKALKLLAPAAEKNGYILAASNDIRDSLSITKNIIIANRMFNSVFEILPIKRNRSYTAGFSQGARLASVVPTFVNNISGVLSCGASVANTEVLSTKKPFHFIGIVGDKDFNYPDMLVTEKLLNRLKFPNQLLVFDGGHEWPSSEYLSKALEYFTLAAMTKDETIANSEFISSIFSSNLGEVSGLLTQNKKLIADHRLSQMLRVYKDVGYVDTIKATQKSLRRSKDYKVYNRMKNAVIFKENLIKDDYDYYLEEDILTYNYNNLGWWAFQKEELGKFEKSTNIFERNMGVRLEGYLNALIEDNLYIIKQSEGNTDEEALNFLWMLKTIIAPKDYESYLNVISYNAKVSDNDTALFYLEELLKQGYSDKEKLYALENTTLFRITPEFNELIAKYLKEARYDIIQE